MDKIQHMRKLNILVACEESQVFCSTFRSLGHNAFSCDIKEPSGDYPQFHIQEDALKVAYNRSYKWDLLIGHPPCTYLASSGSRWFYHPSDSSLPTHKRRPHPKFPNRWQHRKEALEFFIKLSQAPIRYIALENPQGTINRGLKEIGYEGWLNKKPCYTQPFHHGDKMMKKTGFWLKNLPRIVPSLPSHLWDKGERVGKKGMSKFFVEALTASTKEERRTLRSKTPPCLAAAVARQFLNHIEKDLLNVC